MDEKTVSPELERHMGHVGEKAKHPTEPDKNDQDRVADAKGAFDDAAGFIQSPGQKVIERAKNDPTTALMIAAFAGFVVGWLVRDVSQSRS